MNKIPLLFLTILVSFNLCSQTKFSGFIRDSNGKPIKQCRVTALFSNKTERSVKTNDLGYFNFPTPATADLVYDSFELYLNLKDKYSISTTDYHDVVSIDKKSNRIDISLAARARNAKKNLNIVVSNQDEISKEPLYFKIQLRATPEPIKKETLAYLERTIKDLKTEIIEETSESGVFKYRYYISKTFETRASANDFVKKLKIYKMKGFVVPFYK